MKTYYKYGLCIIRNGRLLVTEETDNEFYLMPGGRPEAGETAEQTLYREVKEELGVELDTASLRYMDDYEDVAAGTPDDRVHIKLYAGDFCGELKPCSEVKRLVWFARGDDASRLAPVTRNKILPALIQQGLLK